MKIIFATGNEGKLKEIRKITEGLGIPVISMKEYGFTGAIDENGTTFAENALIKCRAIGRKEDAIIMADDSGLEVDALNKAPGIYSARYMGEDTSYDIKNRAIIDQLAGKTNEERSARFVCVIAALFPDGTEKVATGNFEGQIAYEIKGENGFGYDPILYLPEFQKTSAELSPDEKNEISHRGKALREMEVILKEWMAEHENTCGQ